MGSMTIHLRRFDSSTENFSNQHFTCYHMLSISYRIWIDERMFWKKMDWWKGFCLNGN